MLDGCILIDDADGSRWKSMKDVVSREEDRHGRRVERENERVCDDKCELFSCLALKSLAQFRTRLQSFLTASIAELVSSTGWRIVEYADRHLYSGFYFGYLSSLLINDRAV